MNVGQRLPSVEAVSQSHMNAVNVGDHRKTILCALFVSEYFCLTRLLTLRSKECFIPPGSRQRSPHYCTVLIVHHKNEKPACCLLTSTSVVRGEALRLQSFVEVAEVNSWSTVPYKIPAGTRNLCSILLSQLIKFTFCTRFSNSRNLQEEEDWCCNNCLLRKVQIFTLVPELTYSSAETKLKVWLHTWARGQPLHRPR